MRPLAPQAANIKDSNAKRNRFTALELLIFALHLSTLSTLLTLLWTLYNLTFPFALLLFLLLILLNYLTHDLSLISAWEQAPKFTLTEQELKALRAEECCCNCNCRKEKVLWTKRDVREALTVLRFVVWAGFWLCYVLVVGWWNISWLRDVMAAWWVDTGRIDVVMGRLMDARRLTIWI